MSLYLSFCKSLSRSMSLPDDKLSENIWLYGLKHHTVEMNGDVTMETDGLTREYNATQSVDTDQQNPQNI